ncbi:MAG: MBL fold metallo-hydrolase [Candidatus Binatia bacterium]
MRAREKKERAPAGSFRIRFWGVRGSYPVSDRGNLRFGGHTACVEVRAGDLRLIFDGGTGIIPLGKKLCEEKVRNLHLFLSHTHHDHIFGLYFFDPLFDADNRVFIAGPRSPQKSLQKILATAMDSSLFPIALEDLEARTEIRSLHGGEKIQLRDSGLPSGPNARSRPDGEVTVLTHKSAAHPKNGVMLYRVCYNNKSLVYATDIEEKRGGYPDVIEFARGADLLIHDAQYLEAEYFSRTSPRKGWGHSIVQRAAEVAGKAGVGRLVLFHHEPTHDDKTIEQIEKIAQRIFPPTVAAYEGMEVKL